MSFVEPTETDEVTFGALASARDLALRLGVDEDDPGLMLALYRISDRFRGEVGFPVSLTTDDEVWLSGNGTRVLLLPGRPIVGDPVITIDGVPATGVEVGRSSGVLRRRAGWPDGLDNVHVTYTHGYTEIPRDIQDAVLDVAEVAAVLKPGIEHVATGDESVKFVNRMVDTGTTATWTRVVEKYRGDGQQT